MCTCNFLFLLIIQGRPSLFVMYEPEFHKTREVLAKLRSHDISPIPIPAGCTGLVQPLDVSVNCPFKNILQNLTELDIIVQEENGLEKWSVSDRRVSTPGCVGKACA